MLRKLNALLLPLAVVGVIVLNAVVFATLLNLGGPPAPRDVPALRADSREVVRIGVISRYAPSLTYERYQPLLDHLNESSRYRYELKLSATYEDAAQQLLRGDVAASFFGTWIYARLGSRLGLRPILAPRNDEGGTGFHATLVVPAGSALRSVADLAGKRVALPSPSSYAGNWLAAEALPQAGLSIADLDSVHHFDYHQTVVHRVLAGEFDAGIVREAVAREFAGQGIRVIARSGPFPGPPLVVRADASHPAVEELRARLLAYHGDAASPGSPGASEFARGFVAVDSGTYAGIVRPLQRQEAR